jgi:hypothetical protein
MVLTLGHGGVAVATAAAVVLLYRLVSLAFVVAIGWSVWLLTWRHDNHEAAAANGAITIEETRHPDFAAGYLTPTRQALSWNSFIGDAQEAIPSRAPTADPGLSPR